MTGAPEREDLAPAQKDYHLALWYGCGARIRPLGVGHGCLEQPGLGGNNSGDTAG